MGALKSQAVAKNHKMAAFLQMVFEGCEVRDVICSNDPMISISTHFEHLKTSIAFHKVRYLEEYLYHLRYFRDISCFI